MVCKYCGPGTRVNKKGFFSRKNDKYRRFQRYRCLTCRRYFSEQTFEVSYRQKKPELERQVYLFL